MQLSLNDRVIITTLFDDGTSFYWNASIYSKIKDLGTRAKTLFKEVNEFIAWLPDEKRAVIENYYRNVQGILEGGSQRFTSSNKEFVAVINDMTEKLTRATSVLFDTVTLDLIHQWTSNHTNISIPELGEEHNNVYTVDGTYLKSDYVKLVDLCIAIRFMVPVWCEYINIIEDVVAANKCEVSCFGLFRDSPGIIESEAMAKLRAYVDEKSQLELQKAATSIINGMSRAEIPEWILSVTIVRRIGIGDISSDDERCHLVTSIYGYVQGILNRDLDRKNSGHVREKFKSRGDGDEFDKQSQIEQYRVKQDVTIGDVSMFETYVGRYPNEAAVELVKHRELPKDELADYLAKVKICVAYTEKLNELDLIPAQEFILGWIVNDVVPYKIVDRLSSKVKRTLLGIAQAYAWYFKLPDVSIALTALHNTDMESSALVNIPNARVSPNMHQRLAVLYDHSHPNMPEEGNEEEIKRNNVAVKALREVIRGLNNGLFTARAPDELWSSASSYQRSGCVVFKNISEQLVTLIETLNEV